MLPSQLRSDKKIKFLSSVSHHRSETWLVLRPYRVERLPLGICSSLHRKEVIQAHLPVLLPCYDFVPVTDPTLDGSFPCGLEYRLQVLPAPMT